MDTPLKQKIIGEIVQHNLEPTEVLENCQLEWDKRRGVLYVHNKETGTTVLRVCSLPKALEKSTLRTPGNMIDVTCSVGMARVP